MPQYRCKHATCVAYLDAPGYCPQHAHEGEQVRAQRHAHYDQHLRDPAAKSFYNSSAWKVCRANVLAAHPVCQRCETALAQHVHHVIPLKQCTEAQKLDPANLMAYCAPCHNTVEAEVVEETPQITGTLTVVEDCEYRFDPDAAERPIRFITKFCRHYEGKWAGQPFELLDWQKNIVSTLFGWRHRVTGLRRFRELYLITAKGAGKTPLLAAIALFMLLGDGEAGAHVISMASSFEQANLTFDAGKKYIGESPELSKHPGIHRKQYAITAPKHSKWTTISGKPNGRSGPRPSCVIADEAHEWQSGTAQAYDLLCANLFKRSQPLLLVATNAGPDRSCFAWTLHERAMGVLSGKIEDKTLLPIIYEAPRSLDWRSEEAVRAANPSIPAIVSFDQLKPEQSKGEARYRRLYLSQWVTGSEKWIDMERWDAATGVLDHAAIKDAPLYIALDLSLGDDLCAASFVWTTPTRFHVRSRFWLPRVTAQKYDETNGTTYEEWGEANHITLIPEATISPAVHARIAAEIIDVAKANKIKAVLYDRAYASHTIAAIEAAGITCVPIGQGWGVSSGCAELDRRLKDGSITIAANPVLRSCAENVEIETDKRGNYWPVKPNAKGKYAGTASKKIDGIAALVTALTEARKHDFPAAQTAAKQWTGSAWIV